MFIDYGMPDQDRLELKPTIEVRERIERRLNRDFSDSTNDDRTDFLTRIRVGVNATYGKSWKFGLQYQYAHDWILKSGSKATDEGSDVSSAFGQFTSKTGTLTVGRQKVNLGNERLIGSLEWVNVPRSMDGVRFQGGGWDAFAFKIGVGQPKPTDARIVAVAREWKWGQSSLIFKHDQVNAKDVDLTTLTHSASRKYGDWTLDVEAAVQFGKNQGKDQRAWAWHSAAWHPLGSKTKGFVEFNAASGGSNSNTTFTFDNLYPTNHKFYGSMDLQSWRNMNEVAMGVTHHAGPKTDLSLNWHSFSLRDPSDAWYSAGGAPNKGSGGDFIDPTGAAGRNVGWELDLDATHRMSKNMTLQGGIGVFQPGSFVRALNGGSADRQVWMYAQASYRF